MGWIFFAKCHDLSGSLTRDRKPMSPTVRQSQILDLVRQHGRASVEELAARFAASRETIRRDLNVLSEAGQILKVHGAAKLPHAQGEGPFEQRMAEHAAAKREIARKAAPLVGPGDTVFIDTGSTTLFYAEAIAKTDGLTVVTNSTEIARIVGRNEKAAGVYLLGGAFDSDNLETHGPMALSQISSFRARHAVITVGGIHAKAGLTDFNIAEAQVASAMIDQSESLIVLADASKFNRIGPFAVCPLKRINYLVADSMVTGPLRSALSASNVNVVS
jgi:DeoR/GlpR family transcriptional regulator of sugar metabolism